LRRRYSPGGTVRLRRPAACQPREPRAQIVQRRSV